MKSDCYLSMLLLNFSYLDPVSAMTFICCSIMWCDDFIGGMSDPLNAMQYSAVLYWSVVWQPQTV